MSSGHCVLENSTSVEYLVWRMTMRLAKYTRFSTLYKVRTIRHNEPRACLVYSICDDGFLTDERGSFEHTALAIATANIECISTIFTFRPQSVKVE